MSIYDAKSLILACSLTMTVVAFSIALLRKSDWSFIATITSVGFDLFVSASMTA